MKKTCVLVIMTDMTNYEALQGDLCCPPGRIQDVRAIRLPYTNLSTSMNSGPWLERKDCDPNSDPLHAREGNITHPIPDLTGYITEGQIIPVPQSLQ